MGIRDWEQQTCSPEVFVRSLEAWRAQPPAEVGGCVLSSLTSIPPSCWAPCYLVRALSHHVTRSRGGGRWDSRSSGQFMIQAKSVRPSEPQKLGTHQSQARQFLR